MSPERVHVFDAAGMHGPYEALGETVAAGASGAPPSDDDGLVPAGSPMGSQLGGRLTGWRGVTMSANTHEASSAPGLEARLIDKFPALDPTWPVELQAKWFDGFAKLMDIVRGR